MNCSRKLGPNTTNVNRVVRLIVDNVPFGWLVWNPNLFVLWDDYRIDCMEHTKSKKIILACLWMCICPFWQLNTDYEFRFIALFICNLMWILFCIYVVAVCCSIGPVIRLILFCSMVTLFVVVIHIDLVIISSIVSD